MPSKNIRCLLPSTGVATDTSVRYPINISSLFCASGYQISRRVIIRNNSVVIVLPRSRSFVLLSHGLFQIAYFRVTWRCSRLWQ